VGRFYSYGILILTRLDIRDIVSLVFLPEQMVSLTLAWPSSPLDWAFFLSEKLWRPPGHVHKMSGGAAPAGATPALGEVTPYFVRTILGLIVPKTLLNLTFLDAENQRLPAARFTVPQTDVYGTTN
jgi:hypothetical protein